MEYLKIQDVIKTNQEGQEGIKQAVQGALVRLEEAQKLYPTLIMEVVKSGNLQRQIDLTNQEIESNPRIRIGSPLSAASGPYFLNEDVIGGSREGPTLRYLNDFGAKIVPDWQPMSTKIKLAPGIGFIEAPAIYKKLIALGLSRPELTVNYTAPSGTKETRNGIRAIMDSRIDPEKEFYPEDGVFLTEGATEGIDLALEAISVLNPASRVVFLGLSYYTGPFSAVQKGLKIDRLIASPINQISETKFFPTPEEISKSLSDDTKALFLTIPNNPNGETYSENELEQIMKLAKERNLYVLYDCIFENLYFDSKENYRSKFLQVAERVETLDRVITIDSLSKTKNFPGERVGFMATANQELITAVTNIVLKRRCNPRLTLGPLIQFEGIARTIKAIQARDPSANLDVLINQVAKDKNSSFGKDFLKKAYLEWEKWDKEVLRFYDDNLKFAKTILDGSISAGSPDKAAFNTLVKLSGLEPGINSMDFLAKLMFTMATYTQVGPCFGLSQKVWDKNLGLWSRVTYACSRKDLAEALVRLITFTRFYAEKNFGDPNKFPALNISYDNQI